MGTPLPPTGPNICVMQAYALNYRSKYIHDISDFSETFCPFKLLKGEKPDNYYNMEAAGDIFSMLAVGTVGLLWTFCAIGIGLIGWKTGIKPIVDCLTKRE